MTLVPDSGIYALMARVNKVLLCPHAVVVRETPMFLLFLFTSAFLYERQYSSLVILPLPAFVNTFAALHRCVFCVAPQADGGALCSTGHLMVAVAAREFSVPVVGVAGTFTLTPLFAHNQVTPSCTRGSTLDT